HYEVLVVLPQLLDRRCPVSRPHPDDDGDVACLTGYAVVGCWLPFPSFASPGSLGSPRISSRNWANRCRSVRLHMISRNVRITCPTWVQLLRCPPVWLLWSISW